MYCPGEFSNILGSTPTVGYMLAKVCLHPPTGGKKDCEGWICRDGRATARTEAGRRSLIYSHGFSASHCTPGQHNPELIAELMAYVVSVVKFCSPKKTMCNGLDQLPTASSLTDTLKELQDGMQVLYRNVNHLKTNALLPREPFVVMLLNKQLGPCSENLMHKLGGGDGPWSYSKQPTRQQSLCHRSLALHRSMHHSKLLLHGQQCKEDVTKQVYPSKGNCHSCSAVRQSLRRFKQSNKFLAGTWMQETWSQRPWSSSSLPQIANPRSS